MVSELHKDLERCRADMAAQDAALAAMVEQHEAARAAASDSTDRSKAGPFAFRVRVFGMWPQTLRIDPKWARQF